MEPDGRPTPRLILVGREQAIAEGDTDAVLSFYGGLFERLPAEARQVSASPRFIGYRNYGDDGITRHFFGIEADAIESIPAGMIAWEVDGAVRTVWRSDGSRERVVSRDAIRWQWLEQCGLRAIGEFGVRLSADECGSGPGFRNYVLSCVSAAASNRSDGTDDVDLVEYDPCWPERYQEFEARLRELLGTDIARRIEHYGSTAIPGMPAKPVIDVLVEVPDFAQAKRRAAALLSSAEWEYWWYSGHMVFIGRDGCGRRTHHVHMAPAGHKLWEGIAFRDHLRLHPEAAARYAALKRDLADRFRHDRERYTTAKTDFVRSIIQQSGGVDCGGR